MQMCVSQNDSHVRLLLFADGEVQQLIPFPGQLPAPAHFIVVANGCSRCVAFLFVLSVFRTDYSCGVYCVYAYISMCVRVRPISISSPAKYDFLHVYLCVCHFSLPRERLIHASAPTSIWAPACWNLSISCLDSRAPKQEIWVPTSEFDSIYILFVCWCGCLLASFPLSRAACGLTKTETDLYNDIANIVLRIRANPAGWGKQEWQKLTCGSIFLEISLSLLLFSTYYMMYNKVEENGYFWCFPSE